MVDGWLSRVEGRFYSTAASELIVGLVPGVPPGTIGNLARMKAPPSFSRRSRAADVRVASSGGTPDDYTRGRVCSPASALKAQFLVSPAIPGNALAT